MKKFILIVLAAILAFVLAACGGGASGDGGASGGDGNTGSMSDSEETGITEDYVPVELSGLVETAIKPIADSPYLSITKVTTRTIPAFPDEGTESWTTTFDTKYDKSSGSMLMSSAVSFSDYDIEKFEGYFESTAWFKDGVLYKRINPGQEDLLAINKEGFTDSAFTIWDEQTQSAASEDEIIESHATHFTIYKAEDLSSETVEELSDGNTLITQVLTPEAALAYARTVTVASPPEDDDEAEIAGLTLTYTIDASGNLTEFTSYFFYQFIMYEEVVFEDTIDSKFSNISLEPVEIEFPPQDELDGFDKR